MPISRSQRNEGSPTRKNNEPELSLDSTEDDLECAICGEIYLDPRELPCTHTFCLKCLFRLAKRDRSTAVAIKCPFNCHARSFDGDTNRCRHLVGDVRNLPKNTRKDHASRVLRASRREKDAQQCISHKISTSLLFGDGATLSLSRSEDHHCEWCGHECVKSDSLVKINADSDEIKKATSSASKPFVRRYVMCPECNGRVCEVCVSERSWSDHTFLCCDLLQKPSAPTLQRVPLNLSIGEAGLSNEAFKYHDYYVTHMDAKHIALTYAQSLIQQSNLIGELECGSSDIEISPIFVETEELFISCRGTRIVPKEASGGSSDFVEGKSENVEKIYRRLMIRPLVLKSISSCRTATGAATSGTRTKESSFNGLELLATDLKGVAAGIGHSLPSLEAHDLFLLSEIMRITEGMFNVLPKTVSIIEEVLRRLKIDLQASDVPDIGFFITLCHTIRSLVREAVVPSIRRLLLVANALGGPYDERLMQIAHQNPLLANESRQHLINRARQSSRINKNIQSRIEELSSLERKLAEYIFVAMNDFEVEIICRQASASNSSTFFSRDTIHQCGVKSETSSVKKEAGTPWKQQRSTVWKRSDTNLCVQSIPRPSLLNIDEIAQKLGAYSLIVWDGLCLILAHIQDNLGAASDAGQKSAAERHALIQQEESVVNSIANFSTCLGSLQQLMLTWKRTELSLFRTSDSDVPRQASLDIYRIMVPMKTQWEKDNVTPDGDEASTLRELKVISKNHARTLMRKGLVESSSIAKRAKETSFLDLAQSLGGRGPFVRWMMFSLLSKTVSREPSEDLLAFSELSKDFSHSLFPQMLQIREQHLRMLESTTSPQGAVLGAAERYRYLQEQLCALSLSSIDLYYRQSTLYMGALVTEEGENLLECTHALCDVMEHQAGMPPTYRSFSSSYDSDTDTDNTGVKYRSVENMNSNDASARLETLSAKLSAGSGSFTETLTPIVVKDLKRLENVQVVYSFHSHHLRGKYSMHPCQSDGRGDRSSSVFATPRPLMYFCSVFPRLGVGSERDKRKASFSTKRLNHAGIPQIYVSLAQQYLFPENSPAPVVASSSGCHILQDHADIQTPFDVQEPPDELNGKGNSDAEFLRNVVSRHRLLLLDRIRSLFVLELSGVFPESVSVEPLSSITLIQRDKSNAFRQNNQDESVVGSRASEHESIDFEKVPNEVATVGKHMTPFYVVSIPLLDARMLPRNTVALKKLTIFICGQTGQILFANETSVSPNVVTRALSFAGKILGSRLFFIAVNTSIFAAMGFNALRKTISIGNFETSKVRSN